MDTNSNLQSATIVSTSGTERNAPSGQPFHLDIPERQFQAIVPSDHEDCSPEELQDNTEILEADARSVIGVSIGRAQTRLTSPQTPAAEKAAAIAYSAGAGFFDGAREEDEFTQLDGERVVDHDLEAGGKKEKPLESPTEERSTGLPSPWTAKPKTFERQNRDHQEQQQSGPTSLLSDLNVKRYISNFNLTSLPKASSFKDFSVPSISSMLNNARSHSPMWKSETRPKRANTDEVRSPWGLGGPFNSRSATGFSPVQDSKRGRTYSNPRERQEKAVLTSAASQIIPPLRRATSDESLLLRRVTSNGSSLGDDSRWENVQEQVNSRMKAIKDSLQDSSVKLPGIPNVSGFNLNAFRPDFIRSRAYSEAKGANISRGHAGTRADTHILHDSHAVVASGNAPKTLNAPSSKSNGKISKSAHSHLEEALEKLTGDLVIMGGYRGSILRSAQPPHRQLWVPVKVGLNIRKVNLEVGLKPEDEEAMHDHIFASGMLSHIGPVDMGRRLLKRLRACKNAQMGRLRIHDYGYDWRLSPHLLSRRLLAFLQELSCNSSNSPAPERGATVIAHSMGGLITRHAVNQRPDLFAGVVYAGVPQHCINILGPLRNGDEVLLSSKVLTAQVNFTLRSTYLLLPESGRCFMNKETKDEYPVNFFDIGDWKKYALSPCIAPALLPSNPHDNKSLFESVTDMLPPMPSLPILGRKAPTSRSNDCNNTTSTSADTTNEKVSDVVDTTATRALDPQLSPPSSNYANQQSTIPLADALNYLDRTLNATLAFKAEMVYDPTYAAENVYPPLSVLYANNTPTVFAARVSSREAIRRADAYDDLQFASGDGVCLARAAMLPEGYNCVKGGKIRTERGHVGLLGDLEAVGKCLDAVIEGRRRGIGLGDQNKSSE